MDDDDVIIFQGTSDERLVRKVARRLTLRIYLPLAGAGLLIALLLELHGRSDDAVGFGGGAAALLGLPWLAADQTVLRNRTRAGLTRAYRIDRTGITITAGFDTKTTPWSKVRDVRRWRGQMAVYLGWRMILGIPTGSLTEPERNRLYRVLRSRGEDFSNPGKAFAEN